MEIILKLKTMNYTEDQITKAIAPYVAYGIRLRCDVSEDVVTNWWIQNGSVMIIPSYHSWTHYAANPKLLLCPLSKIWESDAKKVARLAAAEGERCDVEITTRNDRHMLLHCSVSGIDVEIDFEVDEIAISDRGSIVQAPYNQVQCVDFLRSRGYDLPSYHLNGKTLIEAGLAIDATVNEKEEAK